MYATIAFILLHSKNIDVDLTLCDIYVIFIIHYNYQYWHRMDIKSMMLISLSQEIYKSQQKSKWFYFDS